MILLVIIKIDKGFCYGRVQVAIYDDRLEITSPGMLANGLTLKGMLEGKTSTRNACIVNVFSYLNIIEN